MTSAAAAGVPLPAWTAQRVEVYVDPAPRGAGHALPGAVLGHGERPRDAAARALTAAGLDDAAAARESLRLVRVLSDVRPLPTSPAHPGLHVLRLLFAPDLGPALPPDGAVPPHGAVPPDGVRWADPLPAPLVDTVAGAPPRVQRPAAYAVVVHEGQVLLTRLSGAGLWTLPGGGIDHGEHPDLTVHREAFEEAGVELSSIRLADVDSRHFTGRNPYQQVEEDFHGVRLIYRGEVTDRRPPQVQEVGGSTDDAAWVPLAELGDVRTVDLVGTALARLGMA